MSDNADVPPEDPLVGRVIQERFRVEKKLGQGGMGAIYLAEHLLLQKRVAIKCLHAGLASNPEVVRRFKNEAVAASSIGHPNIVEVMDMGRFEDGTFYMVLEYLQGRDFQEDLDRSGAQPVEKVAHIGVQVCAALGAAAKKGIVHRDLKPENVFLTTRHGDADFVKVLDFGISKILDGTGGATKTGELMGTPYYMAPEQVLGDREISHLADVYALGVILFQALSGDVPFDGNTLAQIIMKIATEEAPPLEQRAPIVPPPLSRLVARMLSKDPAARPQDFQEVALGLGPFLAPTSPFARAGALEKIDAIPPLAATPPAHHGAAATQATQFGTLPAATPQAFAASRTRRWGPGRLSARQKAAGAIGALVLVFTMVWISVDSGAEGSAEVVAEQPVPERVRIQISTVPPRAKLFLDDRVLENPFDGEFDKDDETHELVVKLDGYEDERRELSFASSAELVIPLSKDGGGDEPPAAPTGSRSAAPRPSSGTKPSPSSGASTSPKSSPSPAPQSSPSSGSDRSHTPPKPIRDLERSLKKIF